MALCVSILRIYTRLCRELNAGRNKERRGERRIKAKKRRKKKKKKNKGKRAPLQRRGGGVEETVEENLFCISTNLRAGRTRPVAQPSSSTSSVRFARREVSTPESCFMISTKVVSLRCTFFSVLQTANRRPRCNTIPLPLVCFYEQRQSLHLSPFRIDEFIAGTARSIVTKIVYDIDSSFYVNPVSEWFCLAYFTHDALAYTRNQNETLVVYVLRIRVWNNARVSIRTACKFVCELVRVTEGSLGTNNYVSTNLRGNGRFPETHDARSSRYVVAMLIGAISIVSIGKRIRAIATL